MTVTGEGPRARDPQQAPAATEGRPSPRDAVHRVCPYLVAADGGWRSVHPTKDHRCGATQPPAALALVKQRDLCLRPGHAACATYVAARDLEAESAPRVPAGDDGFWPPTRATVLALEPARAGGAGFAGGHARGGQAALVGLIVVAFLVLVIARTTPATGDGAPGGSIGGGASASAMVVAPVASGPASSGASSGNTAATPSATAKPATPVPPPTAGPTGSPSVRPSAAPTPSTPAGSRSYTVKSGDTLSSIAGAFGITVKQLRRANGLASNVIHRGQVLVIPAP